MTAPWSGFQRRGLEGGYYALVPPVTLYQVWQHRDSREFWAVRLELDELTGIHGPLPGPEASRDLSELLYEEHPDDFEWVLRSSDAFSVVRTTH